MIHLKNVKKIYKTKECETLALNGVDLHIAKGDYVAIMGTSGSGKSTLLNILGGMDALTEGEYEFNDLKIHQMSNKQLHQFRKKHISFVFQQFELMNQYTVYENVEVPLIAQGIAKKKRKAIIEECLKNVGIAELAQKFPTQISGGQQQRCAIARAMASGNELLLADEPTGALDKKTTEEIMQMLTMLNEKGTTIVVITHDENVAKKAKRIIRIEDGKLTQNNEFVS